MCSEGSPIGPRHMHYSNDTHDSEGSLTLYLFELFGYVLEVSQDGLQILHDCLDLLFYLYFGDNPFSVRISWR